MTTRTFSAMVIAAALTLSGGCTKKILVPAETRTVVSDTVRLTRLRVDTIASRDSVIIIMKGDTLREYHIRERERLRTLTDTVCRHRADTVVRTVVEPGPASAPEKPSFLLRILLLLSAALLPAAALLLTRNRK